MPAGGFDHCARRPGVHRRVGAFRRPSTGTAPPSSGDPGGRPRPAGGQAPRLVDKGSVELGTSARLAEQGALFEPLGLYKGGGNEMMAMARPTGNWLVSPSPTRPCHTGPRSGRQLREGAGQVIRDRSRESSTRDASLSGGRLAGDTGHARWRLRALALASVGALVALGGALAPLAPAQQPQEQEISLLFAQTANRGTMKPIKGPTPRFNLELFGVNPQVVWFSDRPARQSGQTRGSRLHALVAGLRVRRRSPQRRAHVARRR